LCPQLLELGHHVTAFDICYFGEQFLPHQLPNFRLIRGDIRDTFPDFEPVGVLTGLEREVGKNGA
jgi:hypothetical protein